MKLDLNNIDDVFKDGLEDFSEQPSAGLWDKISGKMFWYELLHFRFVNIPKIWLGGFAGLIVLAVLSIFWLTADADQAMPGSVEKITGNQEITQKENISDADVSRGNQANENVSIISSNNQQEGQAEIPSRQPEDIVSATGTDILQTDKPSQQLTISDKQIISDTETNSTEEISQATVLKKNAQTAPAQSQEVLAVSATVASSTTGDSNEASKNIIASSASAGLEKTSPKDNQESAVSHESGSSPAAGITSTRGSESRIMKLPCLAALSFSSGESRNYRQRPAQRNFYSPNGVLNRGYKPYFSASVYYAPELTEYHRVASESRENSYLVGLAVSYSAEKYTIQTGLEYSRFDDLGDFLVNINSYDSIGFYNGISGFEIDPENPGELIFHTHTVEVWDTLAHHSHQQTRNNYSYLQIPVLFGYMAMESGIFTAHIKAGPSFSFLLNREEPALDFHAGSGARITGVDNYTASRLNTSVQVLVSLALQFQISGRAGILVEPTYRYYLNSVYDVDAEAVKNPYGIGIRGGIFVNF